MFCGAGNPPAPLSQPMHARSRMRLGALYRLVKKDTNHNTYRCALDVVRAVIRREEPGLLA